MHHLMYADVYVQQPAYLIFYSKTLPGLSMITPLYHEPLPPVRALPYYPPGQTSPAATICISPFGLPV